MADRTRSANHRDMPQNSSSIASQNPPRRSTRSTRSRSRDISGAKKVKPGANNKKTAEHTVANDEDGIVDGGILRARKRNRNGRSKPLEDLSTVQEDVGIEYPDLSQNKIQETIRNIHNKKTGQRPDKDEQKSPGNLSAFSGSTARASYSTQDLADQTQEDIRKRTLKKVALAYEEGLELSRTSTVQTGASNQPKSISFNSPKVIEGTVSHLQQRKAARRAQESSRKNQPAETVNPVVHNFTPPHRVDLTAKALSAPGKITTELVPLTKANDSWRPVQDEESLFLSSGEGTEMDLVAKGRQVIDDKDQHEAESDKENAEYERFPERSVSSPKKRRFIDRQANAQKVPFESQESNPPPRQNDGLRRDFEAPENEGYEEMDDPSSDEGFQHAPRKANIDQRRVNKSTGRRPAPDLVAAIHLSPKKARSARTRDNTTDDINNAVARHNQDNNPIPSQLENYKIANTQARLITAVQHKKVQSRKAWTEEETERLIELIEKHGTSWKLLKEYDNGSVLKYRDQTALKDKARNMKVDFLKAGPDLPENFYNIALNKNQTDKLRSLGIEYNSTTGRRNDDEVDVNNSDGE